MGELNQNTTGVWGELSCGWEATDMSGKVILLFAALSVEKGV